MNRVLTNEEEAELLTQVASAKGMAEGLSVVLMNGNCKNAVLPMCESLMAYIEQIDAIVDAPPGTTTHVKLDADAASQTSPQRQ